MRINENFISPHQSDEFCSKSAVISTMISDAMYNLLMASGCEYKLAPSSLGEVVIFHAFCTKEYTVELLGLTMSEAMLIGPKN